MKIVQFQAMPNNEFWQGAVLCLSESGVMYITEYNDKTGKYELVPYEPCQLRQDDEPA